jgi:hypothetical protein
MVEQAPDPTKLGPVAAAQLELNQQLSQALPHASREQIRDLQRRLESLPDEAIKPAIEQLQDLPEPALAALKQHLRDVRAGQVGGTTKTTLAAAQSTGQPLSRLEERLEAWAADLNGWTQQREGLLHLLELVTRDHPNSAQMDAINGQLRATLEQLQAIGEQLRAIRTLLSALRAKT